MQSEAVVSIVLLSHNMFICKSEQLALVDDTAERFCGIFQASTRTCQGRGRFGNEHEEVMPQKERPLIN